MVVVIAKDELGPLKTVMRDLQLGASRYYAATGAGGELGPTVRMFIANCQILNDWFVNAITDAGSYQALFVEPKHSGVGVIDAMKYVRNVSQHVLHVVKPSDTVALVGGVFGFRNYAHWEAIPSDVDAKLRPGTRALKPAYEKHLEGQELMSTMMAVLRFYAEIAPDIVHRDRHGEWTGFPLMSQPGISDPLHPEEPIGDLGRARAWMDSRKPGGDARLICAQVTVDGEKYTYGYTFVGRLSFAPFFETYEQVERDIALGFAYFEGDLAVHASDVSGEHPDALQGHVVGLDDDLANWATVIISVEPRDDDWCSPRIDPDGWRNTGAVMELGGRFPEHMAHEVRRARRLNALVPPRSC